MNRIASPRELRSELRQILAYAQGNHPSRSVLAGWLSAVANRVSMEHSSPEALKKYLQEHPGADKSNHTVKKTDTSEGSDEDKPIDWKAEHAAHKSKAEEHAAKGDHISAKQSYNDAADAAFHAGDTKTTDEMRSKARHHARKQKDKELVSRAKRQLRQKVPLKEIAKKENMRELDLAALMGEHDMAKAKS